MEGEKVVGKRNGTAWLKGKMRKREMRCWKGLWT
jgi:hypothetical protein